MQEAKPLDKSGEAAHTAAVVNELSDMMRSRLKVALYLKISLGSQPFTVLCRP